jgi:hypothetical protein
VSLLVAKFISLGTYLLDFFYMEIKLFFFFLGQIETSIFFQKLLLIYEKT